MTNIKPKIIIVAGPTASGKSAFALELAQKTGGVIINADSQQLYAPLPILTARPTAADEAKAPHKLYGMLNANERPSAGSWLRLAKMEIDWARAEGRQPIVVGGTGLYIKALMQGLNEMPEIPAQVRIQAENDYEQMGKSDFEERLRVVDPGFFDRLKVYDKQRLIRAYEVWLGSGKSLSWWQQQEAIAPYAPEEFELHKIEIPREELYRRCDERFLAMIKAGAVEEVAAFFSLPIRGRDGVGAPHGRASQISPPPTLPPTGGGNVEKIIGAREIMGYLAGETTLDEAIAIAQQATRNYAKRQMTWLRNQL